MKEINSFLLVGAEILDAFSCTPGETFKKDCNSCTCTLDGKNAVCTLKNCGGPAVWRCFIILYVRVFFCYTFFSNFIVLF